jgi:hypothetical protein
MSLAMYEKQKSLLELYQKLGEAEIESASGAKTISHAWMMKKLKEKVNG